MQPSIIITMTRNVSEREKKNKEAWIKSQKAFRDPILLYRREEVSRSWRDEAVSKELKSFSAVVDGAIIVNRLPVHLARSQIQPLHVDESFKQGFEWWHE